MLSRNAHLLTLCLVSLALGACTTPQRSVPVDRATSRPLDQVIAEREAEAAKPAWQRPPQDPRSLVVASGTGLPMTWDSLVSRAAAADVVLIGEQHGHPLGLAAADALWQDTLAVNGSDAALAMEFFYRDEQIHLDDFNAGLTDLDGLVAATDRNERSFPIPHRDMVQAAQDAGAPVLAANAPWRYLRPAREGTIEFSPEQASTFVVPDAVTEGPYADRFFNIMAEMSASHSDSGAANTDDSEPDPRERFAGMFMSQNIWDATMADTVARAVQDGHAPVFLVVGQFHTDFEGGLTERLRNLIPRARIVSVSVQNAWSERLRDEDRARADAIIYAGPAPAPTQAE
jgi:uncharacterized iron-regulated protein